MKLIEMLGMSPVEGDVGIEIEIEGEVPPLRSGKWQSITDGSLRGGLEYVTVGALNVSEVHDRVAFLKRKLQDNERFSFRCSLHVHVNMLDKNVRQLLNTIYLMYLMEPVFFKNSGEQRVGNRFCLGVAHADAQVQAFESIMEGRTPEQIIRHMSIYNERQYKYSATNLCSVRRMGTIEIRTMEGTVDPARVQAWCNFLVNIREFASSKSNFNEIVEAVFEESPEHFIRNVLNSPSLVYKGVNSQIQMQRSLLVNIEYKFPNKVFPNAENSSVQDGVSEREAVVPTIRGAANPPRVTITDEFERVYYQLRQQRDTGQFQW